MLSPAGHTATYASNQAGDNATVVYGNIHGNAHFAGGGSGSTYNQCLRDLRATDPREDRARIEGEKDTLLKDCYAWVLDDTSFQRWRTHDESRLLWIKGDPGKGKTMMTMGVIDELSSTDKARPSSRIISKVKSKLMAKLKISIGSGLLAYFFCQNTRPELNNAVSVLHGLIYQLVVQREKLMRYVQKRYEAAGSKLFEGPNAIYALREILSDMLHDPSLPTTYLLVDALDECVSGLPDLLRIITDDSLAPRSRVKWLVTSRNVPDIERHLEPDSLGVKVSLEVSASHVPKAVAAFVDVKVRQLAAGQKYDPSARAEVEQVLYDKAEGTFLWVSLVCKELEGVPLYSTRTVLQALPPGLDPLYNQMMARILAQKDIQAVTYCKDILCSITLACRPLQVRELAVVAGLPDGPSDNVQAVIALVSHCGSFLTIRDDTVSFIHLSAKDYFTSGDGQRVFNGSVAGEQKRIVVRLLDAMHSALRRDMCDLKKPGTRIQEAADRVKSNSLLRIAYASEYWVDHLQACARENDSIFSVSGQVHSFFQEHLLHWLETMSLLGKILEAISAMQKLQAVLKGPGSTSISETVHDALRFAMWSGSGIQEAPLQVYYGALVFAPKQSIVRSQYRQEMPKGWEVKCGLDDDWCALLQTLEGHASLANSVVFSPAGDRLASASDDNMVQVWDVNTGKLQCTLNGHADMVTSVAFSPAGDRLASTSYDNTVRVWDANTGELQRTFNDHTGSVTSVAFSPAGDRLASGSRDKTVRVWDANTGKLQCTLNGHTGSVNSVAFSPAGDRLASASDDDTVRVWDANTGELQRTFEPDSYVARVAFSSDGAYLKTDLGLLLLQASAFSPASPREPSSNRVFVKDRWLTLDSDDIVWLPANYKPQCTAVHSSQVVLGFSSGRVLLLHVL